VKKVLLLLLKEKDFHGIKEANFIATALHFAERN
jgi:hypothetical protein